MYCTKCGADNIDGVRFCESCGSPMGIPQSIPAIPPRRRFKPAYYAIGVVLIIALILGGIYKFCGPDNSQPELVVNNFINAVEKKDQAAALECIAPYERDFLADYSSRVLKLIRSETDGEIISTDNALENVDFNIDGVKLQTEIDGDVARVRILDAYISAESVSGERGELSIPEDLEDEFYNVNPPSMNVVLVKDSGNWYISPARTIGEFYLELLENESRSYRGY